MKKIALNYYIFALQSELKDALLTYMSTGIIMHHLAKDVDNWYDSFNFTDK